MMKWALALLITGLIASLLGFTELAGGSYALAQVFALVALVLFLILTVATVWIAAKTSNAA